MEASCGGQVSLHRRVLVLGETIRTGVPIQQAPTAGVGGQHALEHLVPALEDPGPRLAVHAPQHIILVAQQLGQEVDVLHGQSEDLVLAELLVRRVGGDELAELGECPVHVLLSPALAAVGEDPTHDFGLRALMEKWRIMGQVKSSISCGAHTVQLFSHISWLCYNNRVRNVLVPKPKYVRI